MVVQVRYDTVCAQNVTSLKLVCNAMAANACTINTENLGVNSYVPLAASMSMFEGASPSLGDTPRPCSPGKPS